MSLQNKQIITKTRTKPGVKALNLVFQFLSSIIVFLDACELTCQMRCALDRACWCLSTFLSLLLSFLTLHTHHLQTDWLFSNLRIVRSDLYKSKTYPVSSFQLISRIPVSNRCRQGGERTSQALLVVDLVPLCKFIVKIESHLKELKAKKVVERK